MRLWLSLLAGLLLHSNTVHSKAFNDGLYSIKSGRLDNGLTYILKENGQSSNAAIFIAIDGGLEQFSCEKQQVPHVLEHLVFSGNEVYSTAELRKLFTSRAGNVRAMTWFGETYYEIEIHSAYTEFAITSLYDAISKLQFTTKNLSKAKNEIHSEFGTSEAYVQKLFAPKRAAVDRAIAKLYPHSKIDCTDEMTPERVELTDVEDAYRKLYKPDNIYVIVVGDIDEEKIRDTLQETFGKLPKSSTTKTSTNLALNPVSDEEIVALTKPLAVEANVGFVMRAAGYDSVDYPAMDLFRDYLHDHFNTLIHSKKGEGYKPRVKYDANPYYGHYVARVETTYNWAKQLNALLKSMSNDLKMHGISNEAFETIRKRKILELESKTWANKEVAKLYKNHRHEIKSGAMKNLYQYYQNLSYSDFQRTVKKYMSEAPVYYTRRPPTLLQMGKDVIIAFGSIFVLGLPFLRFIKKHRQKRMQECGH